MSGKTGCGGDFITLHGVEVFCANCSSREADDCVECFAEESHFERKVFGVQGSDCGLCGGNGAAGVGNRLSVSRADADRPDRRDMIGWSVRYGKRLMRIDDDAFVGLREATPKYPYVRGRTSSVFKKWKN